MQSMYLCSGDQQMNMIKGKSKLCYLGEGLEKETTTTWMAGCNGDRSWITVKI